MVTVFNYSLRSKGFPASIFRFLSARKLGSAKSASLSPPRSFQFFLRSSQFSRGHKAENASNGRKSLRKRLLRRPVDYRSADRWVGDLVSPLFP